MGLVEDGQLQLEVAGSAGLAVSCVPSLGQGSRAGYRMALPALRARRLELGLSLAATAAEVGLARETLGEIERGEYRASPATYAGLCRVLDCEVDEVFAAAGGRRRLPERKGEWTRATVAKRILRLNEGPGGPVFCRLVADGVVQRDGSRGRYCYHVPELERLVPPDSLRLDEFAREVGLNGRQLDYWRRCGRLVCFQPWEQARFYVRAEDRQAFLEWFARKPYRQGEERRPVRGDASDRKREAVRANMQAANAQRRSKREAFESARAELGLLDIGEIAAELGVSEGMARAYIRFGELEYEVRVFGGLRVYFARREAVRELKRAHARSVASADRAGSSRRAWLDADSVVERYRALGWLDARAEKHRLSVDQAELLVRAEVRERRALILRHARGRKPSTGPSVHHVEWAREFEVTKDEYECDFELGGRRRPPTNWEVALDVAERDWKAHPERWRGYASDPNDPSRLDPTRRRGAADRLLKAIKACQRAQKKISLT
jgi:DNA-binding XRE family transcriptional regulator/DNA-binding transcriptional MerR regulator